MPFHGQPCRSFFGNVKEGNVRTRNQAHLQSDICTGIQPYRARLLEDQAEVQNTESPEADRYHTGRSRVPHQESSQESKEERH